jgi:hypothetical protein
VTIPSSRWFEFRSLRQIFPCTYRDLVCRRSHCQIVFSVCRQRRRGACVVSPFAESHGLRATAEAGGDSAASARRRRAVGNCSACEQVRDACPYVRLCEEDHILLTQHANGRGLAAATYVDAVAHLRTRSPSPRPCCIATRPLRRGRKELCPPNLCASSMRVDIGGHTAYLYDLDQQIRRSDRARSRLRPDYRTEDDGREEA